LALFFSAPPVRGQEFTEGRIKLVLYESTGRFSLYYMTDTANRRYEPFFVDHDPRTSFLTLIADDRTYKLGEASAFKISIRSGQADPAIIFEAPFMAVTEEFSFIRTAGSELANGVRVTLTAENRSSQTMNVGLRFLLDTSLGEEERGHFETDRRSITGETRFSPAGGDRQWYSRNKNYGLMGSITGQGENGPDSVLVSNWKRLNDAPWKTAVSEGRNFNLLPYSVNDSAVAYYFEPAALPRGAARTGTLLLAAGDSRGFAPGGGEELSGNSLAEILGIIERSGGTAEDLDRDLSALGKLVALIDGYIASGADLSDQELDALETALNRLRALYSQ
jgi:hypothetical protein